MSTCNFDSRVKFGLYAFEEDSYTFQGMSCQHCYEYNHVYDFDDVEVCCEFCGEPLDLSNLESYTDYIWVDDYIEEITDNFKKLNCKFHTIKFESGYYESAQIVIEDIYYIEDMDNEDTKAEFGLCLSETKRQYGVEERKIEKWLKWVCENYPIGHYELAYQFSNGEAGYSKVT